MVPIGLLRKPTQENYRPGPAINKSSSYLNNPLEGMSVFLPLL